MKRTLLIVAVAAGLCLNAQANVYVAWQAGAGFYYASDPGVGILGSGTGNSCLYQLIWSSDAAADPADYSTTHYVTGNDVWLNDFTVTEDGIDNDGTEFDSYAWFLASEAGTYDDGGVNSNGGYIYARVFQDTTVDPNDWYYVGAVEAADNLDPNAAQPPSPQTYDINRDLLNGDPIDDAIYGAQVVPEPGTMALFALGLLTLAGRRLRRK